MGLFASLFELAADVIDVVRERQNARKVKEDALRESYLKGYRHGSGLEGGPGKGSQIGKDARAEWDADQVAARKRDEELRDKMRGG